MIFLDKRFCASVLCGSLLFVACDEVVSPTAIDASVDARADANLRDVALDQGRADDAAAADTGARDGALQDGNQADGGVTDVGIDVSTIDVSTDATVADASSRDVGPNTIDALVDAAATDAVTSDAATLAQFVSFGGPAAPANARSWGYSVSVSGDGRTLVVADLRRSTRVFERTDASPFWRETFVVTTAMSHADLGYVAAISADGSTFAVSSYETGFGLSGPVFVYTRAGDTWAEQARLRMMVDDPEEGSYFGTSLAISGDGNSVVVGADQGTYLGALVFTRTAQTWDAGVRLAAPPGDGVEAVQFGRLLQSRAMATP